MLTAPCLGNQCAGSLAPFHAVLDEVIFLQDARDDSVCQESRLIRRSIDLRLHVFELSSKGIDKRIHFEHGPVKVSHVRDTGDQVVYFLNGFIKRSPYCESYLKELFYKHNLVPCAAFFMTCMQRFPHLI